MELHRQRASFGDHFWGLRRSGTILGSFWDRSGMVWDRFGIVLAAFWVRFRVVGGSLGDRRGTIRASFASVLALF